MFMLEHSVPLAANWPGVGGRLFGPKQRSNRVNGMNSSRDWKTWATRRIRRDARM